MNNNIIGSSETTREPTLLLPLVSIDSVDKSVVKLKSSSASYSFNFDNFLNNYQPEHVRCRPREEMIRFLEWFVGFSEGDGCFEYRIASGRPRLSFTIAQVDPTLLFKVRAGLGFGTVKQAHYNDNKDLYRFRVEDKTGIRRLMAIFNGNLVLPKVRHRYETWVSPTNRARIWPDFQLRVQIKLPSLETAWLSGFIEAEGCFYAKFFKSGYYLDQRFTLTQKEVMGERAVLEQIRDLFQSDRKLSRTKSNSFRIEIRSLQSQQIIVNYLRKFCLKGKKGIDAFRWWRIFLLRSTKSHLKVANKKKVRRLVKSLNVSTKTQIVLKFQEEGIPKHNLGDKG